MRRAFTLIELLVVIAIISVLMGILLPALGAARRHAQSVAGSANLRSLSQVMLMYTNDNQGAFLNPFQSGCTQELPCPWVDCTDVYDEVSDDGSCCEVWDFSTDSMTEFTTEYFSHYWYSYLLQLDDVTPVSDVQMSPADNHLRELVSRYGETPLYEGPDALWPTSFLYSPTFWCSVDRYQPDRPREPNALNVMGKTQYHSSVGFPSAKVLLFERRDFEQRDRVRIERSDSFREGRPPAWNNLRASTATAVVDGSVEEVRMADLYLDAESDDWDIAPVGIGRGLDEPPILLTKGNNPSVVGGSDRSDGEYPLFFWPTQYGVEGRDLPR